jgi:hypothetical protein
MFRRNRKVNRVGKKFVSQRKLFVERLDCRMLMAGLEQPQPLEISAQFANTPLTETYYDYLEYLQTSHLPTGPGPEVPAVLFQTGANVKFEEGVIRVQITGAPGNSASLRDGLFALDALDVIAHEFDGASSASGTIAFDKIPELYEIPELVTAQGPSGWMTNVGATITQGDKAQKTDDLRDFLSITGAGQKIGVISDSFNVKANANTTAAQNVASFDLPGAGNHPYGNITPPPPARMKGERCFKLFMISRLKHCSISASLVPPPMIM